MENHFDQVANDWDKNQAHLQRTQAIAADMLAMIEFRPEMTGLEFGAGTGLLSFALKEQFKAITLMDSSVEMNRVAASKIKESGACHLQPVLFDLEKNDFPGGPFDMVFTQMTLHHVRNILDIIRKFYGLLNPGGILVIADLYTEDGSFHEGKFEGHHGFDPEELMNILVITGFSKMKQETTFIIRNKDIWGMQKNYPVFLIVAEK